MRSSMLRVGVCIAMAALVAAAGCAKDDAGDASQTDGAASSQPATGEPAVAAPPAGTSNTGAATAPAATDAAATAASNADSGAQVFQTYCQTCHGAEGKGDGPAAVALNPKPASFSTGEFKYDANGNGKKGEVEDIQAIVRDGAAKYGGSPLMAPWPMLSAEQLQAVAQHVKSLGGPGAAPAG